MYSRNKEVETLKTCLDLVRIWFGILSQSDTGTEFIDGISSQVNLIHNLTLSSENSNVDINPEAYFETFIKERKYWSHEFRKIAKYVSTHFDVFMTTYNEIMKQRWFKMNVKTPKEKQFLKRLLNMYHEAVESTIKGDNNNYLSALLNMNNTTFNELKQKPHFARSYTEAAYTTWRTVFANTRITVNNRNKQDAIKEFKNFDMLLAMNKKVHLNQQVTFYFQYNNHTQYGDNETYNNWIDVKNFLNCKITKEFDKINFDKLEKNMKLIEATFASHRH